MPEKLIGTAGDAKETRDDCFLNDVLLKVKASNSQLQHAISNLSRIADRAFGQIPEKATDKGSISAAGLVGEIDAAFELQTYCLNGLSAAIERISKL